MTYPAVTLMQLYCSDLEASRAFYAGLGLHLEPERHGGGPVHYSAQLGGAVLELYPAGDGPATRTRLHLVVPGAEDGSHTDPDGNTVRVWAPVAGYPPAEHLTVGALHALTRGWPAERPVMLRCGERVPRVAVYGSQIATERFHGADRSVLLLADSVLELHGGEAPTTPPATVGDLIAQLHRLYPEAFVLAPAPNGGFGHLRIGEAVVQQRTVVPTGEGRYIDPATAAGDGPIGPAFPAVTISWEAEEK